MKKQILILVLFVMAAFAGVNKSYGQAELTPVPGTTYHYLATGTPAGTYAWSIFDVGTDLLNGTPLATTTYFTGAGATTASFDVTWTPAAVGKTFYVVIKYSATVTPPAACAVMNMKVFKVVPVNSFILTVTTNAISDVCPPPIVSAAVSGTSVQMDYGVTTLIYNVNAKGLSGVWRPTIRIPALGATQEYQSVKFDGTALTIAANSGVQQDLTISPDVAVSILGNDYSVEVVIKNKAYETTTAQIISLEVDGLLGTDHLLSDIVAAGDPTLAGALGTPTVKKAAYSITARPLITTSVTGGFMPILP